jgi:hypothetical protein
MFRQLLPPAVLCVMLSTLVPLVAQSDLKISDLMTAGEFQRCGLQKLTDSERAALDAWVTGFAQKVLEIATKKSAPTAAAAIDFASLEGALLIAEDGQFLGKITTNAIDSQSLLNNLGRYGSELSSTSIFNELSRYGGEIARLSPFNSITSTPPRIFKGNAFVGYLTTNRTKSPRIDPHALIGWLKANQ